MTVHLLRSLSTTTNHKDKLPPAEVSKDEYVKIYMQHVLDRKRPQAEMDGANPPPAPACHGRRSHAGQHVDLMLKLPSVVATGGAGTKERRRDDPYSGALCAVLVHRQPRQPVGAVMSNGWNGEEEWGDRWRFMAGQG